MIILTDVARIAKQFGSDPSLIQSVELAEGNIIRAVQCTYPHLKTREEVLPIVCRSANHAAMDFINEHAAAAFIDFWGPRWAPPNAKNDPRNLNKNWETNVLKFWKNL